MLSVEIQAEAVQAANVTPDFTAEAPWGEELEIEQCVHEADNTVSEVSQQSFLTVSYEGAARNLILAPDNFFRNFPVLMPGDEWEDTFTLVNTTASRAEFLRTELPEELSETEKELLSKVKLEIREGDSVIYEGDLESEGLWAAKSLGICSPDERKEICFSIRVPSELGNEWALRKSGVNGFFCRRRRSAAGRRPLYLAQRAKNRSARSVSSGPHWNCRDRSLPVSYRGPV